MTRYVALPRPPHAWWAENDCDLSYRPTCDVIVTDKSPVDTGLVDADGVPLYRVSETVPMGFRR